MLRNAFRGLLAATALVAVVSSTAAAQEGTTSRFGLKAGLSLPMGDFGDAAGLGLEVGGHVAMPLTGAYSLRFAADFSRFGGNDDAGTDNSTLLGGVANIVYRMTTASELDPYFFGGVGFYNWKSELSAGGSVDDSDLAFNIGVGYDFKFGGRNLFTELRYLSIQADGGSISALPIVLGIRF